MAGTITARIMAVRIINIRIENPYLPSWRYRLNENELVADLRGHFKCAPVNFTIENQGVK